MSEERVAEWAWLAGVCSTEAEYLKSRPMLANPWTVAMPDGPWTVATNRHRMVGVRGEYGFPNAPDDFAKTLAPILDRAFPGEARAIDLNALRSFVGCFAVEVPPPDCATCKNTGEIVCEECNGEGESECSCSDCGNEHTSDCATCCGDGKDDCPDCDRNTFKPDRGRIFGTLFDRTILRYPLQHLRGDLAAWSAGESNQGIYRLETPEWRLLVMPLRDTDTPPVVAPEFSNHRPEEASVEIVASQGDTSR